MSAAEPLFRNPPGPARRDVPTLSVECAAQQRLRDSSYPGLRSISCAYECGMLVLSGRVRSYYLKQLAQSLVAGLQQVSRVSNRVEVVQPPERE